MDALISDIGRLDLQKKKKLYVDGLNFADDWGFASDCHARAVINGPKQIFNFCSAARLGGWDVVVFIDAASLTKETIAKWRARRNREVRTGTRRVPQVTPAAL